MFFGHEKVADEFTEKLVAKMAGTVVGAPTTEGAEMCGLVNAQQLEKVSGMVERALAGGAEALTGGRVNDRFETGYHFEPTVLTGVQQEDEVVQQEIFGPVLPVLRFGSFDEAIALANGTAFGLAAGVFRGPADLRSRSRHEARVLDTGRLERAQQAGGCRLGNGR